MKVITPDGEATIFIAGERVEVGDLVAAESSAQVQARVTNAINAHGARLAQLNATVELDVVGHRVGKVFVPFGGFTVVLND